MRDYDAYVLMIGCGLETCTAIHLPEETIAADIYVRPHETGALYQCRDRHGTVHEVWARRHWRLDRDFPKFAPPLAARSLLRQGDILGCPFMIVSLRELLRAVFATLIVNPRGTLRFEDAAIT
jgi:aminoglycoside N3'-acetyltransferase